MLIPISIAVFQEPVDEVEGTFGFKTVRQNLADGIARLDGHIQSRLRELVQTALLQGQLKPVARLSLTLSESGQAGETFAAGSRPEHVFSAPVTFGGHLAQLE